jgi:NAD+ kinase
MDQTSPTSRKSAGIISKPGKEELATVVPEILRWLKRHGYEVVVDLETAEYTSGVRSVERDHLGDYSLEFVVVLGGDGTLLSAARAVAKAAIPILGINLGSLGFLTEVPRSELFATLDGIEAGCCTIDERSMVHCDVMREGEKIAEYDALNDVIVGKGTIARLNHCDVYVNRAFVSSYQTDCLIVATPTGSTAYSLAAGGPILMPSVGALVVTPVSAHSLTHRPLVVGDSAEIELVVKTGNDNVHLSVDGQIGMPLQDADRVICQKSQHKVKLLHFHGTFFDVLRTKMKWGQR